MSPVDQALPSGEPVVSKPDREQTVPQSEPPSYTGQQSPNVQSRDSIDSTVYQEFYASENSNREAVKASKKQPTMQDPPALPQRSSMRASRILDTFTISKVDAEPTPIARTTPHDVYLSSEEEASSSADDFSDYDGDVELYDSSSEESQEPSVVRRKSHEVTARVVSVIFSGRPSIIDVSITRRSISPSSVEARRSIEPASIEERPRTSIASTRETASSPRPSTSAASAPPSEPLPLRSSSMILPAAFTQNRPAFLNNDPFPKQGGYEHTRSSITEEITRPKSHSAVLKSVTRSLSIVKKKSRPLLNSMGAGSSMPAASPENLSSPSTRSLTLERSLTPQNHEMSHSVPPSPPMSDEFVLHSEPVSRQESSAYAHPPPPPPPRTPVGGSMKGKLLAMARRRSIHIRAATRV